MQFNRERNLNKLVERTRWRHHPFLSSISVHLCSMSLSVHPSPVRSSSLLEHDVALPRRLARLIEIETSAPFQRTFIARRAIIRFSAVPGFPLSLGASTPASLFIRRHTRQNWRSELREFMDFQLANRHPRLDRIKNSVTLHWLRIALDFSSGYFVPISFVFVSISSFFQFRFFVFFLCRVGLQIRFLVRFGSSLVLFAFLVQP